MKKARNYPVAQINTVLPLSPKTLISLWDIMNQFPTEKIAALDRLLEEWAKSLDLTQVYVLTERQAAHYRNLVNTFTGNVFTKLAWKDAERQLLVLQMVLDGVRFGTARKKPVTAESVHTELRELQLAIYKEMRARKFVVVENSKSPFLEDKHPFGNRVSKAFPSAAPDIRDASNCLAVDLNTAAVFHLMRALEFGLRAMARHLKVNSFKKKPTSKPIPTDLGTWEDIIVALNNKLTFLRGATRSKKRERDLDFYNELLNELRSVKDLIRNKVMHARVTYDYHQAQSAFDHVKAFMQRLATKVSETN